MKASIDENGMITIEPENGAEAYALKNWAENIVYEGDAGLLRAGMLMVKTSVEPGPGREVKHERAA